MKFVKNYALGEAENKKVAEVIAAGKETYKEIGHIICESDIDASVYFEYELETRDEE